MCSEAQPANEITTRTRTAERVDWLSQFQETGQTDRDDDDDDDDDPFAPSTLNRIDNREGQNKKRSRRKQQYNIISAHLSEVRIDNNKERQVPQVVARRNPKQGSDTPTERPCE